MKPMININIIFIIYKMVQLIIVGYLTGGLNKEPFEY